MPNPNDTIATITAKLNLEVNDLFIYLKTGWLEFKEEYEYQLWIPTLDTNFGTA